MEHESTLEHHTVVAFDAELDELTASILQMGELVQSIISLAKKGLSEPKHPLEEQANEIDAKINDLDTQIEKKATVMLALRQPKAIDLRVITSTLKVASILERMGDLAKNNVKRSNLVPESILAAHIPLLEAIVDIVNGMIDDVLRAFKSYDPELAYDVWKRDDEVDKRYYQLFQDFQEKMEHDPQHIPDYLQIMFAAKNFERLADHTTKIAKIVYYVAIGKRAKNQETAADKLGQLD